VLTGAYKPGPDIPEAEANLLATLAYPDNISRTKTYQMEIPLASYRSYWKKAKENTSSYPDALSFSTMKAGSTSLLISQIECMLANIPP